MTNQISEDGNWEWNGAKWIPHVPEPEVSTTSKVTGALWTNRGRKGKAGILAGVVMLMAAAGSAGGSNDPGVVAAEITTTEVPVTTEAEVAETTEAPVTTKAPTTTAAPTTEAPTTTERASTTTASSGPSAEALEAEATVQRLVDSGFSRYEITVLAAANESDQAPADLLAIAGEETIDEFAETVCRSAENSATKEAWILAMLVGYQSGMDEYLDTDQYSSLLATVAVVYCPVVAVDLLS